MSTTPELQHTLQRNWQVCLFYSSGRASLFWGSRRRRILSMKNQLFVPAPPLVGVEPNLGPRESRKLSEEERWLVIFLSTEEHRSPTAITRRLGISRHTVYNVLNK